MQGFFAIPNAGTVDISETLRCRERHLRDGTTWHTPRRMCHPRVVSLPIVRFLDQPVTILLVLFHPRSPSLQKSLSLRAPLPPLLLERENGATPAQHKTWGRMSGPTGIRMAPPMTYTISGCRLLRSSNVKNHQNPSIEVKLTL